MFLFKCELGLNIINILLGKIFRTVTDVLTYKTFLYFVLNSSEIAIE